MTNSNKHIASPLQAHGVWTPGVVLMRNLGFRSKAVLISLVFLLPMLLLLVWLMKNQTDQAMQERMNATREHVEVAYGVMVSEVRHLFVKISAPPPRPANRFNHLR